MKISNISYFSLVVLISVLAGCKKDTEEIKEDTGKPSGSITVSLPGSAAWNDVDVTVDASHTNEAIAKVELYADGQWIAEDNQAPFEFSWDTRSFEDGEIELMARITDELENYADVTTVVEVMNTLIDFKLHKQYLPMDGDYKYFVYLIGENRETLFFDQIESLPYDHKVTRPDGYNGETVMLNFAHANGIEGNLISYHDVAPGSFSPVDDNMRGKLLGKTKINFTNIPENDYYSVPSYGSGDLLVEGKSFNVDVYENSNTGYLYLREGSEGKYKIIKDLEVGEKEISLASMGFDMDYHEITLPEIVTSVVYGVKGHFGQESNSPHTYLVYRYEFGALENFITDFHTPIDEFDHFSSFFNTSAGDKTYSNRKYHGIIESQQRLNMGFEVNSLTLENIDISLSGDEYDNLRTIWTLDANGYAFLWESHSQDGDIQFPPIPTELTSAIPKFTSSSIVFKKAEVSMQAQEYDHLHGYQEYFTRIAGRDEKVLEEDGEFYNAVMQSFKP